MSAIYSMSAMCTFDFIIIICIKFTVKHRPNVRYRTFNIVFILLLVENGVKTIGKFPRIRISRSLP